MIDFVRSFFNESSIIIKIMTSLVLKLHGRVTAYIISRNYKRGFFTGTRISEGRFERSQVV